LEAKRIQGDKGTATVIMHYMRQGYIVSVPLTEATRYDLIVDKPGITSGPMRVQVKSTGYRPREFYVVQLRTSGGANNKSTIKKISANECDLVVVSSDDGHIWEFPVSYVADKAELTLNIEREAFLKGQYTFDEHKI
jgi:hypothetical protein